MIIQQSPAVIFKYLKLLKKTFINLLNLSIETVYVKIGWENVEGVLSTKHTVY